jgi:hypothetical protein
LRAKAAQVEMNTVKKYDYGCVMLNVPYHASGIHEYIYSSDVYNNDGTGLETTPHITLLYGLHKGVSLVDVLNVLKNFQFGVLKIGNVSKFDNEHFDVLKFGVDGESLHECNKVLKKLPHTSKFPDYKPHLTVGYLKKGTADYYIKLLKNFKIETYPSYATYSTAEGDKYKVPIKINFD